MSAQITHKRDETTVQFAWNNTVLYLKTTKEVKGKKSYKISKSPDFEEDFLNLSLQSNYKNADSIIASKILVGNYIQFLERFKEVLDYIEGQEKN